MALPIEAISVGPYWVAFKRQASCTICWDDSAPLDAFDCRFWISLGEIPNF
jgi:hypothetical protein